MAKREDYIAEIGGPNCFTAIFREKMKGCGAMMLKVHGHAMQEAGWPDNYLCHHLWHGWLELKVDNRPLQTNQRLCIKDLRDRNESAWVLRYQNETMSVEIQDEAGNTFDSFLWCPEMTGPKILKLLASCI